MADPTLARVLFQTALDLAEARQGGLFVVVDTTAARPIGRLIAPHDLLADDVPGGPPPELTPGDPLAKRALHYLARGRDRHRPRPARPRGPRRARRRPGDRPQRPAARLRRHPPPRRLRPPRPDAAEGARTTAALVASRFGPVLKVSEDGVVSCFLDGARVWDL